MRLHEYQVKSLLRRFQIHSPIYYLIESKEEILSVLKKSHLQSGVVKAQVHAGGRGKAGAVQIGNTPEELVQIANEIMGMKIVNLQTGPDGIEVKKIIVTPRISIEREIYFAIMLDRITRSHVVIASSHGGMDIEQVATQSPQYIFKEVISENKRLYPFQKNRLTHRLKIEKELEEAFNHFLDGVVRAYFHFEATLLEINPLVVSEEKTLLALDAKMEIDDNALFRLPEMKYFIDNSALLPREAKARALELAYVPMNGSIGCVVNGAGLAMATMDLLHFWGGAPANFLDVGGGATEEKVAQGFDLVMQDPNVNVLFVNIFGGIMNCEIIARALIHAIGQRESKTVPIVARIEGTNVVGAKRILKNSQVPIQLFTSLDEAAREAVLLSKKVY